MLNDKQSKLFLLKGTKNIFASDQKFPACIHLQFSNLSIPLMLKYTIKWGIIQNSEKFLRCRQHCVLHNQIAQSFTICSKLYL